MIRNEFAEFVFGVLLSTKGMARRNGRLCGLTGPLEFGVVGEVVAKGIGTYQIRALEA